MKEFLSRNPNAETEKQFEDWMASKLKQRKETNTPLSNNYTIPIIFHIIHSGEQAGGSSNLSKARIDSQLAQLNRDFANLSGSSYSVSANTQIEFCLARSKPDGTILSEPGIERIYWFDKNWIAPPYNASNYDSYIDTTIMPQSIWNPNKYFNVWILALQGNDLGRATFPSSSTLPGLEDYEGIETNSHSGVYIRYESVGSYWYNGAWGVEYAQGKNLTHETGHFLGLRHIWGDKICGTDYCDDTPPQISFTTGCPGQPAFNFCFPPKQKMFENYMDYTHEYCKNTFTQDQKERMQVVMENSPRRVELASSIVCCPNSDLTIIGQSVNQDNIVAGNNLTAFFAEDNKGNAFSAPNYVSFHLSSDEILTPGQNGDVYLDEYFVNQGLAPLSQTLLLSKQLTIPANIAAGNYYLFISADGAQDVTECDEQNNFATVLISVSDSVVQSQVNRYRLWFDNSYNSGVSYNVSPSTNYNIQRLVSTTTISNGLHTLNFQFRKDTLSSSVVSTFFYKSPAVSFTGNGKYEYWTDDNYSLRVSKTKPNSSNVIVLDTLNMSAVSEGLHTFNIRFKPTNGLWSSVVSSFFYKLPSVNASQPQYQYWFDNNYNDTLRTNISTTSNFILLDSLVNLLPQGLHTLHIRFKINGGLWSSVSSSFFYKDQPTPFVNNNIARCVYWYDNNWQNPSLLYYSGQANLSSIINTDASGLSNGMHRISMMFRDERGLWSSVVSDSFNRVAVTPTCPFNSRQYATGVFLSANATKQWQVNTGSDFVNITNNSNYSGANTDTLQITNAPTSWYGYKYRCILTDGTNSVTGQEYTLKFSLMWSGSVSTAWENPANWSCNAIPDGNVDVVINNGLANYPQVNSTAYCRSLTTKHGATIIVSNNQNLIITK